MPASVCSCHPAAIWQKSSLAVIRELPRRSKYLFSPRHMQTDTQSSAIHSEMGASCVMESPSIHLPKIQLSGQSFSGCQELGARNICFATFSSNATFTSVVHHANHHFCLHRIPQPKGKLHSSPAWRSTHKALLPCMPWSKLLLCAMFFGNLHHCCLTSVRGPSLPTPPSSKGGDQAIQAKPGTQTQGLCGGIEWVGGEPKQPTPCSLKPGTLCYTAQHDMSSPFLTSSPFQGPL